MPEREKFNTAVATITRETKEETGAFIARLKSLTPGEFVRLSREDLERLSISQYMHIARAIAPDIAPTAITPAPRTQPPEKTARSLPPARLRTLAVIAGLAVGLAWAFAGPFVMTAIDTTPIVRSGVAADWPRCSRLASDIDGCVYRPGQDLSWDYVAAMLKMDLDTLHHTNRHLPADRVPQGSRLIVWRYLGTLED